MTTQSDYTPEEWNQIVGGPMVAGTAIVVADPAFFGAIKESAAIARAIVEFGQNSEVELIQAIGAAVSGGYKVQTPEVPKDQGTQGALKALIAESFQAVKTIQEKSPEEAEAYARYLVDIAQVTADSSKEGGFLGIGATRVSDQEKAALQQLADALEIDATKPDGDEEGPDETVV
jgi:hypothetical protein